MTRSVRHVHSLSLYRRTTAISDLCQMHAAGEHVSSGPRRLGSDAAAATGSAGRADEDITNRHADTHRKALAPALAMRTAGEGSSAQTRAAAAVAAAGPAPGTGSEREAAAEEAAAPPDEPRVPPLTPDLRVYHCTCLRYCYPSVRLAFGVGIGQWHVSSGVCLACGSKQLYHARAS